RHRMFEGAGGLHYDERRRDRAQRVEEPVEAGGVVGEAPLVAGCGGDVEILLREVETDVGCTHGIRRRNPSLWHAGWLDTGKVRNCPVNCSGFARGQGRRSCSITVSRTQARTSYRT